MNLHSRDRILLKAHGRNKKTVDDVLRPQMQVHAMPDRHNHRCRKNVVSPGGIARIDTERIAFIGLSKLLCVGSTKNSVSSGIAEIPLELRSGYLNVDLTRLLLRRHHA